MFFLNTRLNNIISHPYVYLWEGGGNGGVGGGGVVGLKMQVSDVFL